MKTEILRRISLIAILAPSFTLDKANSFLSPVSTLQKKPCGIVSCEQLASHNQDDDHDDAEDEDNRDTIAGDIASNVLGTELCPCCTDVGGTGIGTGFYRNGYCSTGEQDLGRHTVCVQVTEDFLEFSKAVGNDLSTPAPQYLFPGLKGGDIWCLCAQRWLQAYQAGKAPQLYLKATHEKTLSYVSFEVLREFAIDGDDADKDLDDLNEQRKRLKKLFE